MEEITNDCAQFVPPPTPPRTMYSKKPSKPLDASSIHSASESPTPSQQDSSSTSTVSPENPQRIALVSTSEQFRGDNRPSQEQGGSG